MEEKLLQLVLAGEVVQRRLVDFNLVEIDDSNSNVQH